MTETAETTETASSAPRQTRGASRLASPPAREMPHNHELEQAVLAILLDGRHATAMQIVRETLHHPLVFFERDHRIVYLACLDLDDEGHRVDAQAVAEHLHRHRFQAVLDRLRQQELLLDSNRLDSMGRAELRRLRRGDEQTEAYEDSALASIGGYTAITDLARAFSPIAGLERNAKLLLDYYLKRRLIAHLQSLCDETYRTPKGFPDLIDEGSQIVLDLNKHNPIAAVHAIGSVIDETMDHVQERMDNPDVGVRTGIADLDKRLMSLRPGGLYVLAARPGAGKTSFALNLVRNIAGHVEHPQGVLLFSLEVDRIDLVKKMLASDAGIDFGKLESGLLEAHELAAMTEAAERLKHWKMDMMDVSDLTVQSLRSIVKRRQLETAHGIKLVVIDYLQLLNTSRGGMTEYERVSEISRILKVMAMEMKLPVIALSQMSRESEKGGGGTPREPRLSDLRGSGSIEQDADAVLFIHRLDSNDDDQDGGQRRMKIIIAKNRFGPPGGCEMVFQPARMRFLQVAHSQEDEAYIENVDRLNRAPDDDEEDLFRR